MKLRTKVIYIFYVTSALATTGVFAQGTIGFTNSTISAVKQVAADDGTLINCPKGGGRVALCWAPAGTPYTPWSGSTMAYWLAQNPGWAAVPGSCGMNAPSAGQFYGGTITLPTSTPGATVDCVIFGWTGTSASFDEATSSQMVGVSEKFTVTTGNPLAMPPDAPAAMTTFKGVILAPDGGRIPAQTADGFRYSYYGSGGEDVIITGYAGPLEAIKIPSTIPGRGIVTSFGYDAFKNLTNLTSIIIPDSVTSFGCMTFASCTGLTSITIPDSVTYFGCSTFDSCTGLTNVTIGKSVTDIGSYAFHGCVGLTSITIPYSVTSLGSGSFAFCTNLKSAYFQGDAPDIYDSASVFESAASGFTIYYPATAVGWTTPTWQGWPAQPYQPMLSLVRGPGKVGPLFNGLRLGTNYQLQVSADLKTWSNSGLAFTATNTSEIYTEAFDVGNRGQLFFRLKSVP